VIGFIDYLQIVTASNYNTIASLHTLQITAVHAKPSQSASTSRFQVSDLNNGESSALVLTSLLSGEYPTTTLLLQLTKSQAGGISHQPPSLRVTDWLTTDSLLNLSRL
jgi:hypothetical protein